MRGSFVARFGGLNTAPGDATTAPPSKASALYAFYSGRYQNVLQYAWSSSNGSTDALKSWSTGNTP